MWVRDGTTRIDRELCRKKEKEDSPGGFCTYTYLLKLENDVGKDGERDHQTHSERADDGGRELCARTRRRKSFR